MPQPKRIALLIGLLCATLAGAGGIKAWTSGETLTSSELNSNFSHIHSTMVGGHGARLVNADVSASAAITMTKISGLSSAVVITGAGLISANCSSGPPCTETLTANTNITSIVKTATGVWTVTIPARVDAYFAVTVTANSSTYRFCTGVPASQTTATVYCWAVGAAPATAVDTPFSVIISDNN